jgi:hypothetical protein
MRKGGSGAAKGKRVKVKRLIVLAEAEAIAVATTGGIGGVAIGAAQVPGVVVPTTAAQHAVGTADRACGIFLVFIIIWSIPITAPFPDISRLINDN